MKIEALYTEFNQLLANVDAIKKRAADDGRELDVLEFGEIERTNERMSSIMKQVEQHKAIEAKRQWAEDPTAEPEKDGSGKSDYKPNADDAKKFRSLGQYLLAVQSAGVAGNGVDQRLKRATGMSEGVPADGGFLVQTDFATNLLDFAFKTGKLAGKCDNITISNSSNAVKVPGINETARADGSRQGGIRCYWADEAVEKTASNATLRNVTLTLNKLIGLTYVTDELLADASALESWIQSAFPREIGFIVDVGIINGTGAGQPLGIVTSPSLISVPIEGGQAATTLVAANVMKMYSRMLPDSIPNAEWYINQDVWPEIFNLHLAIGTGGAPMFVPASAGLVNAPYGMLMGRPIVPLEQCQTLGTVGDIVFGDLSYYYFATKGGIKSDSSIHVKFIYDETRYRWVYRCDGQPKIASAITPFNSTSTLSPFVALAARP